MAICYFIINEENKMKRILDSFGCKHSLGLKKIHLF